MEYKTLAELAIEHIFELDDFYKNKFKNKVNMHYLFENNGCKIEELGVFGPYSDFILYLDAREKIHDEDAFNRTIGQVIITELTQNIKKQYAAMHDKLDYFNNRFAACMSVRRKPDCYVFDFADTGTGIDEGQILDFLGKTFIARKTATSKVNDKETKIFIELNRKFVDRDDPRNDPTAESSGMGLLHIFRTCLTAEGKFMIGYNFRDIEIDGVEKRVCDVYSSVERTHLKKAKEPIAVIDKALGYRTKTHVRVVLPIPFVFDTERKIAEKTQAIERASLNLPDIDEFKEYLKE